MFFTAIMFSCQTPHIVVQIVCYISRVALGHCGHLRLLEKYVSTTLSDVKYFIHYVLYYFLQRMWNFSSSKNNMT